MAPRLLQEEVQTTVGAAADRVLTPAALSFLARLHRRFEPRRQALLQARAQWYEQVRSGDLPDFRADTAHIRRDGWTIRPLPEVLQRRTVEITGPVDRKMMINALNSGADVFMADFEDSHSPTWEGTIAGHVNLQDACRRRLWLSTPEKEYRVGPDPALLMVRARGLHLDDAHLRIDGRPVSASLFDFGLSVFHNGRALAERGRGPFYYLPKLEHAEEAAWWNDVFTYAETELGLSIGTIRATVLIETLPAAFEMDEILWALRDHAAALNAGRWDYIFSCIKALGHDPRYTLPDRNTITMEAPFLRAYAQLLVQTCHRRGALAMGGMSAYIPQKDAAQNEVAFAKVRADKQREADDGFDGTWVAHPGLVDVAREAFAAALAGRPNQLDRVPDVQVTPAALLEMGLGDGGQCTKEGLRTNIDVGVTYLSHWLGGRGAVAIHGLMEDAATAEISRMQVWQWLRHGAHVDGAPLTEERVRAFADAVMDGLQARLEDTQRLREAADAFLASCITDDPPAFLTVPAYARLVQDGAMRGPTTPEMER